MAPGKVLAIIRMGPEIRHPRSGLGLGLMVRQIGQVECLRQAGRLWMGRIRSSRDVVLAGDRLLALSDISTEGAEPPAAGTAATQLSGRVGFVLCGEEGRILMTAGDRIFLDAGYDQGLTKGMVLEIRRSVDGEQGSFLGRAQVVSVKAKLASALILDCRDAIRPGDWLNVSN